ncbi:MAG TPA: ASCH domain-containing protein [Gaiellaceae bacterium]|nr:ASCH domain-containing protein [Gaiellaceae bacterium]
MTHGELPAFELGYPRTELRRQLVDAVLRGAKTATAGLAEEFERTGEPPPRPGDRYVLHDFDDVAVAVVEITEADVRPAREIDLQFARDEGEGFESVEDWRRAHEAFFDRPIDDETLIVAQRFRVVDRL